MRPPKLPWKELKESVKAFLYGKKAKSLLRSLKPNVVPMPRRSTREEPPALPSVLWKFEEEFPAPPRSNFAEWARTRVLISSRVVRLAWKRIVEPSSWALFAASAMGVAGVGTVEALYMLQPSLSLWDTSFLAVEYGMKNVWPSCIWSTKHLEIISLAADFDPSAVLRPIFRLHSPECVDALDSVMTGLDRPTIVLTQDDAQRILSVQTCATIRSTLGGFMMILQFFRLVTIGMEASKDYAERVMEGRETPFKGVKERVIRFCGVESNITKLSLDRYGLHILPVFEVARAVRSLVRRHSDDGSIPMFWRVKEGTYGFKDSWEDLNLSSDYLLRSTTGRAILYLEADATNKFDSFYLGSSSKDLSYEDAIQGFKRLELEMLDSLASESLEHKRKNKRFDVHTIRVIRVFLGDTLQNAHIGGKQKARSKFLLRDRFDQRRDVDILIDSRAPVILAVCKALNRVLHRSRRMIHAEIEERAENEWRNHMQDKKEGQNDQDSKASNNSAEGHHRTVPYGVLLDRDSAEQSAKEDGSSQNSMNGKGGEGDKEKSEKAGKRKRSETEEGRAWEEQVKEEKENVSMLLRRKYILLDTDDTTIYNNLSTILSAFGFCVLDCSEYIETVRNGQLRDGGPFDPRLLLSEQTWPSRIPVISYHTDPARTLSSLHCLLSEKLFEPGLSSVILDDIHAKSAVSDVEGHILRSAKGAGAHDNSAEKETIEDTADENRIEVVSPAEILDDLLRQVRVWTRMGHTPHDIQEALDQRYGDVLKYQRDLRTGVATAETLARLEREIISGELEPLENL